MTATVNASTSAGVIVTSDTSGALALQTAGTTALTVTSAQNVGIGTTSPVTKVHAYSSTTMAQLTVDGAGAIKTGINFASSGTTYGQIYFDNTSPYDMSVFQQYSTGSLRFGTNNTEVMRLSSSGNLGIGQTSPSFRLDVLGIAGTNGDAVRNMELFDSSSAYAGGGGGIAFGGYYNGTSSGINDFAGIQGFKENSTAGDYAGALRFTTRANGGSPTERMRIASTGTLIINPSGANSPPAPAVDIYGGSNGTKGALRLGDNTYSAGHANYWDIGRDNGVTGNFTFSLNGTQKGYIDLTTGAYVAVSDSRLKNNITDITYGLAEVLRFRPVMYNMIEEKENSKKHLGLIAQEIKAVIDEAVDDLIDESQQFYGLDKSGLVPVLVKAIQELSTQLTELKAEVATLRGA